MKTKQLPLKGAIVALLLTIPFYFYGCDITDPLDGISVILDAKERETTISLIIRDAATNEPVGFEDNQTVTITLAGEEQDQVIDLINRSRSSFETRRGFVSFAIRDGRLPSVQNPVELIAQINTSSDDYIPVSKRLFVNSTGSNVFELQMVNRNALPRGVNGGVGASLTSVSSDTGTDTDVILGQAELGAETPLRLTIPQGTRLLDANGNALTGELSVEAYHFSHKDLEALQSYPGGLSGTVSNIDEFPGHGIANLLQGESNVSFTPAGFISVALTISGQPVRSADGLMEFYIGIPDDVFNRSGERVTVGSNVPIWSYDREIAEWRFEAIAEVQQTPSDNPDFGSDFPSNFVMGTTNHFSFWAAADAAPVCRTGASITLSGLQMPVIGRLLRTDTDIPGGVFLGLFPSEVNERGERFIDLTNVSGEIPAMLEIINLSGEIIDTVEIPDACTSENIVVDFTSVEQMVITFRGTGVCSNTDVKVNPSVPIFIRPDVSGAQWLHVGNTSRGEITLGIPGPGNYSFGLYFEDRWYQYEADLSGFTDGDVYSETIELPDDICADL
ncbi:hypothetical protein CYPRO_1784 [Cyclonatronum proteinivorum]|uniref:Uncharacterized protein n=1 Tax=Cyclonatronum proteinivorum TaxID=1457365 RepID=A0A345UKN2_9BACT|nr:hypothetical protein [Cyclonatronum proteinivorum]AXJ01034.1 hypothetical protein CYPRO_1784 [Cyclonatronum proteinivorum]